MDLRGIEELSTFQCLVGGPAPISKISNCDLSFVARHSIKISSNSGFSRKSMRFVTKSLRSQSKSSNFMSSTTIVAEKSTTLRMPCYKQDCCKNVAPPRGNLCSNRILCDPPPLRLASGAFKVKSYHG